jgi:hypothetical protein
VSTVYIRFALPVPDLEPGSPLSRAPWLERLLARADAGAAGSDWRAEAFRVLSSEAPPAIGPTGLIATREPGAPRGPGAEGSACLFAATPVHYEAAMTHVRLPPGGVLALTPAVATELALEFNRVFAEGGQTLFAGRDGSLYCGLAQTIDVPTADPERVAGRDIGEWLPTGPRGARLRGLMSEIEMWLFEHALNRRRADAREPSISGLWLWGGGAPLSALPRVQGWVAGRDALFSAWADEAADASAGAGVAVLDAVPGTAAWGPAERRWIAPALDGLRAGRHTRVILSAGERHYSLSARSRWRWWRRPRPWWEYFA